MTVIAHAAADALRDLVDGGVKVTPGGVVLTLALWNVQTVIYYFSG